MASKYESFRVSQSEIRIVNGLVEGLNHPQIAKKYGILRQSVKNRLSGLYCRMKNELGIENANEITAITLLLSMDLINLDNALPNKK